MAYNYEKRQFLRRTIGFQKLMNAFRPYVWDPSLIIGQMTCLQTTFYATDAIFLVLARFNGIGSTLANVFSPQATVGTILVQLVAEIVCAFALVRVVQRARQCLDFVCTFHFFHLIFVIVYNGWFPTKFSWWILQVFGIATCTILGEYLCKKYESQEIQLSQPSKYDL